jgi:hypothetical protein
MGRELIGRVGEATDHHDRLGQCPGEPARETRLLIANVSLLFLPFQFILLEFHLLTFAAGMAR